MDGVRPFGPEGNVILTGRVRDVVRRQDVDEVVDQAFLKVELDWIQGQEIRTVESEPHEADLERLVGVGGRVGFRDTLARVMPQRWGDGSGLSLLLDELPIASSLSRHALIQDGTISLRPSDHHPAAMAGRTPLRDSGRPICAAWVPGGAYDKAAGQGAVPLLTEGLPSPVLDEPSDPGGWHEVPGLRPGEFRRRRRLDLHPSNGPGETVRVTSLLRDTYMNACEEELVIHEYEVGIEIDPETHVVVAAAAAPRALPGPDCSAAAGSAARVIGLRVDELREHVRSQFTGVTTCTHLNDQLRALGDTHRLLAWLMPA